MKRDEDDAAPKGVRKFWEKHFLSILTGLMGATLVSLLFFAVAPRWGIWYVTDKMPFTRVSVYSITKGVPDHADEALWRLALRDMAEEESQRVEERLRDHFTLFLALAGIGTTIVLAGFSFTHFQREEKAIGEMKEIRAEAKAILAEIKACKEKADQYIVEIKASLQESKNNPSSSPADVSQEQKRHEENRTQSCTLTEYESETTTNAEGQSGESFRKPTSSPPGGLEQADPRAIEALRKAAEQGDARAQFNLGVRYDTGRDVEQNDTEALEWYRKAAEQGHDKAQFNVGVMYATGRGVERDDKQAFEWYRKAAEQGMAVAQYNVASRYGKGLGVEQDDRQEFEWYRKAAEQGMAQAQFNVAHMYLLGCGVERDSQKALVWYRKAADQGYIQAQLTLATLYANRAGKKEDQTQAAYWYQKVAEQGHRSSVWEMASRYFTGQGVPENYVRAYAFLLLFKALSKKEDNDENTSSLQTSFSKLLNSEQRLDAQRIAMAMWDKIQSQKGLADA